MANITGHISGIFNGLSIRLDKLNYNKSTQIKFLKDRNIPWSALSVNKDLKNIHRGKRCFIVGNAPSINKQDLSLLKEEFVFTVNFIYKNKQFKSLNTNYHFFMDPGCFADGKYAVEDFTAINTDGNKPVCFIPAECGYDFAKKYNLAKQLNLRYLFDFIPFNKPFNIHGDISEGITGFYTVIQTAVLTAVYMGFDEIYLIGCDCTGIITDIEVMEDKDIIQGYAYEFSKNDKEKLQKEYASRIKMGDTFRGWANIFTGYDRILKFCNENNAKLFNATEGGILDSIPRVQYETLFKENHI